jgi:hypothetical protein
MSSRIDEDEPVVASQRFDIARFVPVRHAFGEAMLEHKRGPFSLHLIMDPYTAIVGVSHRTLRSLQRWLFHSSSGYSAAKRKGIGAVAGRARRQRTLDYVLEPDAFNLVLCQPLQRAGG